MCAAQGQNYKKFVTLTFAPTRFLSCFFFIPIRSPNRFFAHIRRQSPHASYSPQRDNGNGTNAHTLLIVRSTFIINGVLSEKYFSNTSSFCIFAATNEIGDFFGAALIGQNLCTVEVDS
jgi:hypothetical protein